MNARRLAMLWLCAVLLISAVVRAQLVLGGGQMFWADEADYSGMAKALAEQDFAGAAKRLEGPGQYFVFKIIWTIPDALAYADGTPGPALLFFGFVSLIHIVLVWCIGRRLGGSEVEAAAAATLTAAAATMLYYGRHLLPYDCSMAVGLLAIWIGIRRGGPLRSAFVGLLAAVTVLIYPGYWTLAGAALAIHLVQRPTSARGVWRRTWPSFACFAAGLAGAQLLNSALTGGDMRQVVTGYATAVDQGTLGEGWSLPWEYLWHAEHGLLLLWLAGVASYGWRARRARIDGLRAEVIALVLIYGALVVCSVVLGMFVVYGRLARQLVPFLSLLTAHEAVRVGGLRKAIAIPAAVCLVAAVVVQAAFNFRTPLHQVFPSTFQNASQGFVNALQPGQFVWINLGRLYPSPEAPQLPSRYQEVAAAAHPVAYLPYQYEGWTPEERAVLRASDLRMRLIVIDPAALAPR